MKKILCFMAVIASMSLAGCASTKTVTPLAVGDTVNLSGIQDQNDHTFSHQDAMESLLFVKGMGAKDLVRESLSMIDKDCMDSGKLVYLADISGMPSLISKMIAVPKMRDYGYPIWLDRDGAASEALPVKEDQVTLLSMDHQTITSANFFVSAKELSKQLTEICGTSH